MTNALAVVGGKLLTGLADVTRDASALDGGHGTWAVVAEFEGDVVCARFDDARDATLWPGAPWRGPSRQAWTSSLDEASFKKGVATIRDTIARGDVYQVNLCRVLSAPAPRDADVAALVAALAEG